jgi:hypothetical protein
MEETAFAIGTFCVAAAIIGGGLKAAHLWEMPALDSVPRQFLLGGFGLALIVGSLAAGLLDDEDNGTGGETPAGSRSVVVPGGITPGPGGNGGNGSGTGGTGPETVDGCQVTIVNPFVALREQPGPAEQEIISVPPGVYMVEATQNVEFAGRTERWLQITAEGRTGWIPDNTIMIERKTGDCP